MCDGCINQYAITEGLTEVHLSDEQVALAERVRAFYDMPGCSVGGPLHIVIDDTNVEDEHITWSLAQDRSDYPPEVWAEAEAIAAALMAIPSLAVRALATVPG